MAYQSTGTTEEHVAGPSNVDTYHVDKAEPQQYGHSDGTLLMLLIKFDPSRKNQIDLKDKGTCSNVAIAQQGLSIAA